VLVLHEHYTTDLIVRSTVVFVLCVQVVATPRTIPFWRPSPLEEYRPHSPDCSRHTPPWERPGAAAAAGRGEREVRGGVRKGRAGVKQGEQHQPCQHQRHAHPQHPGAPIQYSIACSGSSVQHCNASLCGIALCIVLYCTVLHCTALYCTVL